MISYYLPPERGLSRATIGSSGFDIEANEHVLFEPGATWTISTGLRLSMPAGMEAQVRPRSGLSSRSSLFVILGTIDSDYRGEIRVIAHNAGRDEFRVNPGMRVAQLVFVPIVVALDSDDDTSTVVDVSRVGMIRRVPSIDCLPSTSRGESGFGSSGL